jgi:hypothetical protein
LIFDTSKTNLFIMNDQNPFWDNDDNVFVSGNAPPPQTATPNFDTEMNYQNYLWDDDLEFLNGDDLYVPESTPPSLTATPEFSFGMNDRKYLEDNDLDFLGDELNIPENTLDWDSNLELLEDNNLNVSGNTPNWDNDIEFLEGENLYISENTPLSQPPIEESVLCPTLQSIIEGTYNTPVQPENPILGSEPPQYGSPSSTSEMTSPLVEDLPTPQYDPAERGGPVPGELGPLAHEMDYINFIGTGSHRHRLRPGVVPRRKTAKIVAAADSEPYYNDGPRMEEFREAREMWMTRLKNARTVMSIRHKRMCSQLTRKPNETARKWTNRLSSRTAIMRRADIKHASKMNPSDPAFDSEYRRVFYETKERRHRHNAAERARILLIRRNYDIEHGRPRVPTPTPPDDSDDEKFYDHELDYPCKQPSRKDKAPIMASPMVTGQDSGAAGFDTSPTASLAADLDAGNGDLDQDTWLQQPQANSDAGYRDVPRNPFFLRAPAKPGQESCNPTKKKYQPKCVPRDSRGLRLNARAARKLRPDARLQLEKDKCAHCLIHRRKCDQAKPTCGSCFKNRHICRPQGSEDHKLKTPQRRKKVEIVPPSLAANPEAGNGDLDQDVSFQQAQTAQTNSHAGCGDLSEDTSLQQVQTTEANSDVGYEDLIQDLSFQQAQANSDTGYEDLNLHNLLQPAQVNSDAGDADLDLDTWYQQVVAELDAGYEDFFQDTSFQQTQADSDAGYEDLYPGTLFQQTQADLDTGHGDLYLYTLLQQGQEDSDAECEDFSRDPWFQQVQANSDIGYRVWQNTCLQPVQANPDAIYGDLQDTSFQQAQVNPVAENEYLCQEARLQQARANWVSGYDTRAQVKPDGGSCKFPRGRRPQGRYPRRRGRRARKPQGDIESMRISRHSLVDGRQIMAQPKEDKCILCLTNSRRCDQAKPNCGNCRKRGRICKQQVSPAYLSLYPYNELYSGFPEDVLGAQT